MKIKKLNLNQEKPTYITPRQITTTNTNKTSVK